MRAVKADMEQYKQDVEQARSEFLVLSAQEDKLDGLERAVQSSTPFKIPERIQQLNSLKTRHAFA
jgi:hypothetical protein